MSDSSPPSCIHKDLPVSPHEAEYQNCYEKLIPHILKDVSDRLEILISGGYERATLSDVRLPSSAKGAPIDEVSWTYKSLPSWAHDDPLTSQLIAAKFVPSGESPLPLAPVENRPSTSPFSSWRSSRSITPPLTASSYTSHTNCRCSQEVDRDNRVDRKRSPESSTDQNERSRNNMPCQVPRVSGQKRKLSPCARDSPKTVKVRKIVLKRAGPLCGH